MLNCQMLPATEKQTLKFKTYLLELVGNLVPFLLVVDASADPCARAALLRRHGRIALLRRDGLLLHDLLGFQTKTTNYGFKYDRQNLRHTELHYSVDPCQGL